MHLRRGNYKFGAQLFCSAHIAAIRGGAGHGGAGGGCAGGGSAGAGSARGAGDSVLGDDLVDDGALELLIRLHGQKNTQKPKSKTNHLFSFGSVLRLPPLETPPMVLTYLVERGPRPGLKAVTLASLERGCPEA